MKGEGAEQEDGRGLCTALVLAKAQDRKETDEKTGKQLDR